MKPYTLIKLGLILMISGCSTMPVSQQSGVQPISEPPTMNSPICTQESAIEYIRFINKLVSTHPDIKIEEVMKLGQVVDITGSGGRRTVYIKFTKQSCFDRVGFTYRQVVDSAAQTGKVDTYLSSVDLFPSKGLPLIMLDELNRQLGWNLEKSSTPTVLDPTSHLRTYVEVVRFDTGFYYRRAIIYSEEQPVENSKIYSMLFNISSPKTSEKP